MRRWNGATPYTLYLFTGLLLFSAAGWGKPVGVVVAQEGAGEYLGEFRVPPETAWAALEWGDDVVLLDRLRTQPLSKLDVRLKTGHRFVLSQSVEVSVEEQRKRVVLVLPRGGGTLRVITSDRPGALLVRTSTAEARAMSTGFIASCGPPITADPDNCLFVGVYGRTAVESLAFPGRSVTLAPQFFSEVRKGHLPSPPRLMPDARFRSLLQATTVLGTGSEQDRIGMADPGAAGEEVLKADELIGQESKPPRPGTQGPGTDNPGTVIDQPPTVYGPVPGSYPPSQQPLPTPPPLPHLP